MSELTEKNLDYLEEFWSDISRVENADPDHLQNDILAYVKQMRYYRKQAEERCKLLEHASRIIDSGMGAGILRYDPVQWFISYHLHQKEQPND